MQLSLNMDKQYKYAQEKNFVKTVFKRLISPHQNKTYFTQPMGVLHSFSIKNIFHDKMDLVVFLFCCGDLLVGRFSSIRQKCDWSFLGKDAK